LPLYDYQCRSCQKVTEVRHGFDETYSDRCPACGGEMRRVFNAAGIVFKGSGFYINDSRKGSGDSSKSSSSSSSSSDSSSSSSSDAAGTKNETKSDAGPKSETPSSSPSASDSSGKSSGDSSKSGAAA
jgi:putative FmdB family regulatory protein